MLSHRLQRWPNIKTSLENASFLSCYKAYCNPRCAVLPCRAKTSRFRCLFVQTCCLVHLSPTARRHSLQQLAPEGSQITEAPGTDRQTDRLSDLQLNHGYRPYSGPEIYPWQLTWLSVQQNTPGCYNVTCSTLRSDNRLNVNQLWSKMFRCL